MGDDRPSDNDDMLDDTAPEFQEPATGDKPMDDNDSDDESLLSEVDEAQFADFDPTAVQVAPDFESLKQIKASRKDRTGEEPKKKKEKTRDKVKKNRRRRDSDEGFELDGAQMDGKRRRGAKTGEPSEKKKAAPVVEVDESTLSPEERRKRALDRAMDAAMKKPKSSRRGKGGDIVWYTPVNQEQLLTSYRIWSLWPTKKLKTCAPR